MVSHLFIVHPTKFVSYRLACEIDPPIKRFAQRFTYLGIDVIASRDLGFGVRPGPGGTNKTENAFNNGGPSTMNTVSSKRAASPGSDTRRKREPSPPPPKRFKQSSPPPRERERPHRSPPRREFRREPNRDVLPESVSWFLGTLPGASVFDGWWIHPRLSKTITYGYFRSDVQSGRHFAALEDGGCSIRASPKSE